MDNKLLSKFPKKHQPYIIDCGKEVHANRTRYFAVIKFNDGFSRSIGESNLEELKYYIKQIIEVDRTIEF